MRKIISRFNWAERNKRQNLTLLRPRHFQVSSFLPRGAPNETESISSRLQEKKCKHAALLRNFPVWWPVASGKTPCNLNACPYMLALDIWFIRLDTHPRCPRRRNNNTVYCVQPNRQSDTPNVLSLVWRDYRSIILRGQCVCLSRMRWERMTNTLWSLMNSRGNSEFLNKSNREEEEHRNTPPQYSTKNTFVPADKKVENDGND